MQRVDFLAECNPGGMPLEELQARFCNQCIQPECSRSRFGAGAFENRVNTWHDRLFAKVPRMEAEDPRFNSIAGQKFMLIDVDGPTSVGGGWVDVPVESTQDVHSVSLPIVKEPDPPEPIVRGLPKDTGMLDDKVEFPGGVVAPEPEPVPEIQTVEPAPQWADLETVEPEVPPVPKKVPTRGRYAVLANTPVQPGKVLDSQGKKDPWESPKADPWAAPIPAEQTKTPGDLVVKPGAKVKLGGS